MPPVRTPEAFSGAVIDAQLKDARWNLTDGRSVRSEYVLADRRGRAPAVVEAKRMAFDPRGAQKQARDDARQLGAPLVFLANGWEIWVWDWEREAHPRAVRTFFFQPDLERRAGAREARRDLLSVPTPWLQNRFAAQAKAVARLARRQAEAAEQAAAAQLSISMRLLG